MENFSWSDAERDIAIEIVASRSPEHFPFGLYSWLDVPAMLGGAGVGAFSWFNNPDECKAFIVEVLAADGPEGPTPDAAEAVELVLERSGLSPLGLQELTEVRAQGNAFDWAGEFAELLGGNGAFVEGMRGRFRESGATGPISSDEHAAFLAWLPEAGL